MIEKIKEIEPAIAFELIQNGALLIDIREWEEVEMIAFDIKSMMQLPQSIFADKFQEISKEMEIIIACHSGARSLLISRFLMEEKFKKVYSLKGGIADWEEKGFPVKWENLIPQEAFVLENIKKYT